MINKFRGDVKILEPGIRMLEERTKIPVCGVMPYIYADIDDEDSLSERFERKEKAALLDIAVIRLPRISNFTDFAVLECREEVSLRYVSKAGDFGNPDLVILPGSKKYDGRPVVASSERTGRESVCAMPHQGNRYLVSVAVTRCLEKRSLIRKG